ncbi:unnamed protein product, partial [Caretta caretta]
MAMDTWRLEGTQYPPCNCQKSPTRRVVVALIVVSSPFIAAIIALAERLDGIPREMLLFLRDGRELDQQPEPLLCTGCLPGWSEQEMAFLLRHKGVQDHWIGLQREQGQPWKWTNSTKFNHL